MDALDDWNKDVAVLKFMAVDLGFMMPFGHGKPFADINGAG